MSSAGKKFDQGKLEFDLLPEEVLVEILKVLDYGQKKYKANSWKSLINFKKRYYNAGQRHRLAYKMGELRDEESGLYHLAHSIVNDIFLLWKEIKKENNKK